MLFQTCLQSTTMETTCLSEGPGFSIEALDFFAASFVRGEAVLLQTLHSRPVFQPLLLCSTLSPLAKKMLRGRFQGERRSLFAGSAVPRHALTPLTALRANLATEPAKRARVRRVECPEIPFGWIDCGAIGCEIRLT